MQRASGVQVIAQGGLAHLREIEQVLARRGVPSEIVKPPKSQCGS